MICHSTSGTNCPGCNDQSCCESYYVPLHGSNFNCKWANGACVQSTTACAMPGPPPPVLDPAIVGRRFDGNGGLSAGASSRLLFDYPAQQRSDMYVVR